MGITSLTNCVLTVHFKNGATVQYQATRIAIGLLEGQYIIDDLNNNYIPKHGKLDYGVVQHNNHQSLKETFIFAANFISTNLIAFEASNNHQKSGIFDAKLNDINNTTNYKCVIWNGNNIYSVRQFIEHLVTELPITTGKIDIDIHQLFGYGLETSNQSTPFEIGDMLYADSRFINLSYNHKVRFNDNSKIGVRRLKNYEYIII